MSVIDHPFVCDGPGCGKRRENDSNHWFLMWEMTYDTARGLSEVGVVTFPWVNEEALRAGRKHVCGVACAVKLYEKALACGTLDFAVAIQQLANERKH